MANPSLSVNHLSCKRGQQIIFNDLCFELNTSETLIVSGENGAGKSSLLRLLTGITTPLSGQINWCGKDICHDNTYQSVLHYINHTNGIKRGLTVKENIQLTAHLLEQPLPINYLEILQQLKLQAYLNTQVAYLSAGQQRRVALSKLFLFKKPLWILDEPLNALDTQTQAYFYAQLALHHQQGGIAIISSHSQLNIVNHNLKTLRLS